jgi:hypothetical protein
MATKKLETYRPALPVNVFYVVLQGEFAFFHDKKKKVLRVMAPELENHLYLAGPWLGETPVDANLELTLENVIGGKASPQDPKYDELFLRLGVTGTPHPDKARMNITMPLPIAILPGRRSSTASVKIIADGKPVKHIAPNPTVIPILVYEWDPNGPAPVLTDKDSSHVFDAGPDSPSKALHIYASGLEGETKEHVQEAFTKASALLGVDATISWDTAKLQASVKKIPAVEFLPAGLIWYQINYYLNQRHAVTGASGAMMRGQQAQFPPFSPTSHLLRFDTGNCGPITP